MEVRFGILLEQSRPLRLFDDRRILLFLGEGLGEGIDHFLHEGFARHRVITIHITTQYRLGHPTDGIWWEGPSQFHTVRLGVLSDVIRKPGRRYSRRGYMVLMFHGPTEFGDTRRTTISPAHTDDGGVALFLYLCP